MLDAHAVQKTDCAESCSLFPTSHILRPRPASARRLLLVSAVYKYELCTGAGSGETLFNRSPAQLRFGGARSCLCEGPVAKFGNGRGMGRAGLHFMTAIRG